MFDQIFEGADVVLEGGFAGRGNGVSGIGFATDEGFFYADIGLFFESFEVAGEVAVGYLQIILEGYEIHGLMHYEDGHDTESDTVFKGLVQVIDIDVHRSCLR